MIFCDFKQVSAFMFGYIISLFVVFLFSETFNINLIMLFTSGITCMIFAILVSMGKKNEKRKT